MLERALNASWLLLGLATCWHARTLGLYSPSGPDVGFFPFIAGVGLAAGGAWLLIRHASTRAMVVEWPRGPALRRVLTVLAGLLAMWILIRYVGFLAAAFVTMIVLLRAIERVSWVQVIIIATVSSVGVWWLFAKALSVVLPRGPWGF
jgi:hypothetical protein